jgi:hypothetical protein
MPTAYLVLTSDDVHWSALARVLHDRTKDPVFLSHLEAGKPSPLASNHMQRLLRRLSDKHQRVLAFYAAGYCGIKPDAPKPKQQRKPTTKRKEA